MRFSDSCFLGFFRHYLLKEKTASGKLNTYRDYFIRFIFHFYAHNHNISEIRLFNKPQNPTLINAAIINTSQANIPKLVEMNQPYDPYFQSAHAWPYL